MLRDAPAFGYRPNARHATAGTREVVPEHVASVVDSDATIDLTDLTPPAHYQGSLGSCTAHAGCSAAEGLMALAVREGLWRGKPFTLSRLAVYQRTLDMAGHRGRDVGASGTEMLRALARGLPDDAAWPYSEVLGDELPPQRVWTHHRTVGERALAHSTRAIRAALALSCPVLVGVPVFSGENGMSSPRAFETGETLEPAEGDAITGWHMLSLWAHDPSRRVFVVQHSWRGYGPDRERALGTLPEGYVLGRANEILALGAVR